MKRLLSIAVAALVVSLAAAQSSLEFDVVVQGTTAIAVDTVNDDGDFLNDLQISYSLQSDEPLTFEGSSSFELRYITNEVGTPVVIQQENWVEVPVGDEEEDIPGWKRDGFNTASVGQFKPARITIAAGAVDNDDHLVAVPAFDGALALRVSTEACKVPVYAADFPVPDGFPEIDRGANPPIPAVDFTDLEKQLAQAYIGERQGGSIVVAFDAQEVDFIGRATNGSNYQQSWIRGAACGPNAGEGMTVTVLPEISTDALLPEGTTEVAIVLTIKGEDQ